MKKGNIVFGLICLVFGLVFLFVNFKFSGSVGVFPISLSGWTFWVAFAIWFILAAIAYGCDFKVLGFICLAVLFLYVVQGAIPWNTIAEAGNNITTSTGNGTLIKVIAAILLVISGVSLTYGIVSGGSSEE